MSNVKDEKKCLTPIEVERPPRHTQIHPRCYTCTKFPVCNLREDYLKTALLIQKILGDPQEDYALTYFYASWGRVPGYYGFDFDNENNTFPETVGIGEDKTGTYMEAKFRDENFVQFFYNVDGYYVLFEATYDETDTEFKISEGREVYYGLKFTLSENSALDIAVNLESWRTEQIQPDPEPAPEEDVINTTYFSAELNCDFYEHEKGLSEADGIRRIIAQFPDGVPMKDGTYYHLATFHIEPHKVPCYHPENGKVAFAPMPYPVFMPPKCKRKPVHRRGDVLDD